MGWNIKVGTIEYTEDEVTIGDLVAVGDIVGTDEWAQIDPSSSPKIMAAWVAVALARKTMMPIEQTVAFVRSRSVTEIMAAFNVNAPETPETVPDEPVQVDDAQAAAMAQMMEHARQAQAKREGAKVS